MYFGTNFSLKIQTNNKKVIHTFHFKQNWSYTHEVNAFCHAFQKLKTQLDVGDCVPFIKLNWRIETLMQGRLKINPCDLIMDLIFRTLLLFFLFRTNRLRSACCAHPWSWTFCYWSRLSFSHSWNCSYTVVLLSLFFSFSFVWNEWNFKIYAPISGIKFCF